MNVISTNETFANGRQGHLVTFGFVGVYLLFVLSFFLPFFPADATCEGKPVLGFWGAGFAVNALLGRRLQPDDTVAIDPGDIVFGLAATTANVMGLASLFVRPRKSYGIVLLALVPMILVATRVAGYDPRGLAHFTWLGALALLGALMFLKSTGWGESRSVRTPL